MARNSTARLRCRSASATPAAENSRLAWRVMNLCQMPPTHSSSSKLIPFWSHEWAATRRSCLGCYGRTLQGRIAPLAEAEQIADQPDQEHHPGCQPEPEEYGQLLHGVHERHRGSVGRQALQPHLHHA